jgi:hypothetical protein
MDIRLALWWLSIVVDVLNYGRDDGIGEDVNGFDG